MRNAPAFAPALASALLLAACGGVRYPDEGSVDTTLPNDVAAIETPDMIADNLEAAADNLDAMADALGSSDASVSGYMPQVAPGADRDTMTDDAAVSDDAQLPSDGSDASIDSNGL